MKIHTVLNSKIIIPIIIGIVIVIAGIAFTSNQNSESMEVEDALDRELRPQEETSEISDKLNEIEAINLENEYTPRDREWITSGPFQIDRSEYVLGEKIFVRIGGLDFSEKGQVVFLKPSNGTHYSVYLTVPFDGANKQAFNYYIEPQISKTRGICSIDDIIGEWRVVFRGTEYTNLEFKIINQTLPGSKNNFNPVC